jgi:membrane protease YdiL (CAAX protease family)
MTVAQFTWQQMVLVLAPPFLLLTARITYRRAARLWGRERGYLVGFLFYWVVWCGLLPLATVGPSGFREMFRPPHPPFGRPNWLGLLLLVIPPLSMFLTTFRTRVASLGVVVLVVSALHALANGTMEEVLWRGTYLSAFPDSWLWGLLYPSVWFGLWHLAPQVVYPHEGPGGAWAFSLAAIVLGLVWGWVAMTSGSIRWTVIAHILLDFMVPAGRSFIRQSSASNGAG